MINKIFEKIIKFLFEEEDLDLDPAPNNEYTKLLLEEEGFNPNPYIINKLMYGNVNLKPCVKQKIPLISHHIWLTNPGNPKEISDIDFMELENSINVMDKKNITWSHILWTNNAGLIPKTAIKLSKMNIQIKEVNEIKNSTKLSKEVEILLQEKWHC